MQTGSNRPGGREMSETNNDELLPGHDLTLTGGDS